MCPHITLAVQGGGVYVYGDGAIAIFSDCSIYENTATYVHAHVDLPSRVMGDASRNCLRVLQGGGVFVYEATVIFTDCNIYSNTASSVHM